MCIPVFLFFAQNILYSSFESVYNSVSLWLLGLVLVLSINACEHFCFMICEINNYFSINLEELKPLVKKKWHSKLGISSMTFTKVIVNIKNPGENITNGKVYSWSKLRPTFHVSQTSYFCLGNGFFALLHLIINC